MTSAPGSCSSTRSGRKPPRLATSIGSFRTGPTTRRSCRRADRPSSGKAAIREFVAKSFENPSFRISWKTNDVVVSEGGDFAYGIGTNRVNVTAPDGTPVTIDGKAVTIWRREKDGSWKCVVDIWNDAPPAPR